MKEIRNKVINELLKDGSIKALDLAYFLIKVLETEEEYEQTKQILNQEKQKTLVKRRK